MGMNRRRHLDRPGVIRKKKVISTPRLMGAVKRRAKSVSMYDAAHSELVEVELAADWVPSARGGDREFLVARQPCRPRPLPDGSGIFARKGPGWPGFFPVAAPACAGRSRVAPSTEEVRCLPGPSRAVGQLAPAGAGAWVTDLRLISFLLAAVGAFFGRSDRPGQQLVGFLGALPASQWSEPLSRTAFSHQAEGRRGRQLCPWSGNEFGIGGMNTDRSRPEWPHNVFAVDVAALFSGPVSLGKIAQALGDGRPETGPSCVPPSGVGNRI